MCGLCGYYGPNPGQQHLPLNALKHRGPDGSGVVEGVRYVLGHTRLAIIDVERGAQPMLNEDGSIAMVLNGEIYNHMELRNKLRGTHVFRSDSDTESVLHWVEEQGVRGLADLDGMFALAMATPDGLILARDPLGIKPLYTQTAEEGLLFSSELKALAAEQGEIREFPPGTHFTTADGYRQYYQPPTRFNPEWEWEECLAGIRTCLSEAVRKRLMADVPLGGFLSGGLDSSLICALIKRERPDLHTFSVTMAESNDRHFAALASGFLGTHHHEYVLDPEEMWTVIPEIIYSLESFDRSLVRSAVANYFLARLASEHVKVVLTGEGADELFAGYEYLDRFTDWEQLHRELCNITSALHNTNLQRTDRMTMAHGLEARVPFLDREMVALGLGIPPWYKRDTGSGTTKWCLREAYRHSGLLPEEIIVRGKEKFAEGSGVADILESLAEARVSDRDYRMELERGAPVKSKEECYYFQIFQSMFSSQALLELVGRSRS